MSLDVDPSVDPWLSGNYAPVYDELDVDGLRVTGELPAGLRGDFWRNGPNPQFAPLGRYHLFDGDGMVHAISFDGEGGARYRNRWVESKGLLTERKYGRALFGGLNEFHFPDPEVIAEAGMMKNTANTHLVRHAGRYLALMEAVLPTELSADLETLGEYTFDGQLTGAMTAHPKLDPVTGEMCFIGYSPFEPYLRYHVADASGALVRSTDIELERPVMMHDFVMTERYIVFFDLPAIFHLDQMLAGGTSITWEPQMGARIGVMPRDGGNAECRWIDVEPFFVFHFLNGWDHGDTVVVEGCRSPRLNAAFGEETLPEPVRPSLHRWTIDLAAGTVVTEQLDDRPADFPRINDDFAGRQQRYGYLTHTRVWGEQTVEFDGVQKVDNQSGTSSVYSYGPATESGEPVFAPDPDGTAEDDGWILNFVYDKAADESTVVVLDARAITAGPTAVVHLPRRVPFGFHGNWFPAVD